MFKSNVTVRRLSILRAIITEVKAWENHLGTDEQALLTPANVIGSRIGCSWLPYGFYSIHHELQKDAWVRLKNADEEKFNDAVAVAETQLAAYRNQGIYQPALPVLVSND